MYTYIYICMCVCIYIYIYVFRTIISGTAAPSIFTKSVLEVIVREVIVSK